jgi:hypothetical protein
MYKVLHISNKHLTFVSQSKKQLTTKNEKTMKYLFDIDGIAYEIELSKGETKQLEYKKGKFAKVSLRKISQQPTETSIGSAFLRVEFDNGNVWNSKDAVIPRLK